MNAAMQIFPVRGVDDRHDASAAYWADMAKKGGDPTRIGMHANRCAFLAGFYSAQEGRGSHENPFLFGGHDALIQPWNYGYSAGPVRAAQCGHTAQI